MIIQFCTITLSLIVTVFLAYYAQHFPHNILYKMLRGRLKGGDGIYNNIWGVFTNEPLQNLRA